MCYVILGAKIAAGFLNILCVRTVEKFALRVVGNLWRLLAFYQDFGPFLLGLFALLETETPSNSLFKSGLH